MAFYLNVLGNVRFSSYGFKLYFSGPYIIDREGNITFSGKIKTGLYIFNAALILYLIFSIIFPLRPDDAFTNGYSLLGYFRWVLHSFALSTVILWNVQHSKRASEVIGKFIKINSYLVFSIKQLKWMTLINFIQIGYTNFSILFTLYYIYSRWGFTFKSLTKICNVYTELGLFSAELTFINLMTVINNYMTILKNEMCNLLKKKERAFHLVIIRELVKTKDKHMGENINRLRFIYGKIYDLKEGIHEIFTFPLLVSTATTFANLVYFVFLNTVRLKYETKVTARNMLLSCVYPSIIFLKLTIIVVVCSKFKKNIKKARTEAAKLYKAAGNEKENDSVTGLIQELRYMDPGITCFGFTQIDYEIITSIVGTIITYTIILLQSKFTEDDSDPVSKLLFEF